jgi:hypothetical protein
VPPVVPADAGVENVNAEVDAWIHTGVLRRVPGGPLEPIERVLRKNALMADAFDFEELAINLVAELAQMRRVLETFVDVEVLRVVDRRFGPKGMLLFEVLLHM